MIDIIKRTGGVRITAPITEKAIYKKELMKDEYILLSFSVSEQINFRKGDYIETQDGKFEIISLPQPKLNPTTGGMDYEVYFYNPIMRWKNHILYYNRRTGMEAGWKITTTPANLMNIIVENLAELGFRYEGSSYTYTIRTEDVDATKANLIQFNAATIFDALTEVANTWEAEWWVEKDIIYLGKCYRGETVVFDDSLISEVSANNSKADHGTRIIAFGSTRNLPVNYRVDENPGVTEGIVERRLKLPEGISFVDAEENMRPEDIIEKVVIFEDIYPRRVGRIDDLSEVIYPVEDSDETFVAYRFKDSGLAFSESYILPNEELRIVFQSGRLNGMDFGVAFNPDRLDEADPEAQVFEIVRNESYGIPIPNATLKPSLQDEYVLYGFDSLLVEEAYITEAEDELLEKAQEYMALVSRLPLVCQCKTNKVQAALGEQDYDIGRRVRIESSTMDPMESRILSFEKRLDFRYDATYQVGDEATYSRLREVEEKINGLQASIYNPYATGHGSGVEIIRKYDTKPPLDSNVYSALRSREEFLKRKEDDTVQGKLTFLQGWQGGELFTPGFLGSGAALQNDFGKWHLTVDELSVRGALEVNELVINEIHAVGGDVIISLADLEISEVKETATGWRCYFDNANGTIANKFVAEDQAICQKFDGPSVKRYWRLVTSVGEDFVELSSTDCEAGSKNPEVGDKLVQLGHRTDVDRQSAIYISAKGADGPSIKMYSNIGRPPYSYSLVDKERTVIGRNSKFVGTITQVQGDDLYPVVVDKGEWLPNQPYYGNDRVSYDGQLWLCIVAITEENPTGSTTQQPGDGGDWLLQVSKGETGKSGKELSEVIISGDSIFIVHKDNSVEPSTITLTATARNIDNATYQWSWAYTPNDNWTTIANATTNKLQVGPAMYGFSGGTTRSLVFRVAATGSNDGETVSRTDIQTVVKVYDGQDGEDTYTAHLYNEATTVASDHKGFVSGAEIGTAKTGYALWLGTTQVPYSEYSVGVTLRTGTGADTAQVNPVSHEIEVTGLSSTSVATVVFKVEFKVNGVVVATKDFTVTKAPAGVPGDYEVTIYCVPPSGIPERPEFNHIPGSTGATSGIAPNMFTWYTHVPNGAPVYRSSGTVDGSTGVIKVLDEPGNYYWTKPVNIHGSSGNWVSYAYKANSTNPGQVTSSTVPIPLGWLDAPTNNTGTWWMIKATIDGNTGKGIPNSNNTNYVWSYPLQATGTKGDTGATGAAGNWTKFIYRYGTTNGPYNGEPSPSNNPNPTNGWSTTIPSTTSSYPHIWMSEAIINGATGGMVSTKWSTAVRITGEDGTAGQWTSYVFKSGTSQPTEPSTTNPQPYGWADYPETTGTWWMSMATVSGQTNLVIGNWSKCVKVTGVDGAQGFPGLDGATFQYRYAIHNSSTTYPTISQNSVNLGTAWQPNPPTLTTAKPYMWMTTAKFNYGTTFVSPWSTPVRISGEQGPQGVQGSPGEQGLMGPAMDFRGTWSSSTQYYKTNYRVDVVKHGDNYYMAKQNTKGNTPSSTSGSWESFGADFTSVATGLLFAEKATISGWNFNNNYIWSPSNNVYLNGNRSNADTPIFACGKDAVTVDSNGNMTDHSRTAAFKIYSSGTVTFGDGDNEIKAVGKKGKTAVTDQIHQEYQTEKWGEEAAIKVSIISDEADTVWLETQFVDAKGIRCLDSKKYITYEVVGDGTLVCNQGTSTGSRILQSFNGRTRIKVLKNGGKSIVAVKAEGIPTVFIEL